MNFHFFYGGPLSQWYPSKFTVDGTSFVCAEQYMMAQKAVLFDDWDTYDKIMAAIHPMEHKRLGRLVKNFSAAEWNARARDFVLFANREKFKDRRLLRILQDTAPAIIVEASPTDRVWGIGLSESDPRRFNPKEWRGTNWLGEVLMAVRDGWSGTWSPKIHLYKEMPPL